MKHLFPHIILCLFIIFLITGCREPSSGRLVVRKSTLPDSRTTQEWICIADSFRNIEQKDSALHCTMILQGAFPPGNLLVSYCSLYIQDKPHQTYPHHHDFLHRFPQMKRTKNAHELCVIFCYLTHILDIFLYFPFSFMI